MKSVITSPMAAGCSRTETSVSELEIPAGYGPWVQFYDGIVSQSIVDHLQNRGR